MHDVRRLAAALLAAWACAAGCGPGDEEEIDLDGDGWSAETDCEDADAAVHPEAAEVCDARDNDCDGVVDEGFDFDLDGFFTQSDPGCAASHDEVDCSDNHSGIHPGAVETCNSLDDDCNGFPDDAPDADADGYGPCEGDCDDASTSVHPDAFETCDGRDNDCNGLVDEGYDEDGDSYASCGGDCDDADPAVHPGSAETCDGVDNDCDGAVDPGFDEDGDGWTTCGGDCDDADSDRYPGAGEVCNDVDDDCDGAADDGFDLDSDGYLSCGDPADCDDLDPGTRPGGIEVCDGKDNDCDGAVDEDFPADGDGDGYGVCEGDCDDTDPDVGPGMPEICNAGIDDDCDFTTSETLDTDGDGFGVCQDDCNLDDGTVHPGAPELCDGLDNDCDGDLPPGEEDVDGDGVPVCAGDCDDEDAGRYPGAPEDPTNGLDDDCDTQVDEVPSASGYAVASQWLLSGEVGVPTFDTAGAAGATVRFDSSEFPTGIEAVDAGLVVLATEGGFFEVDLDGGTATPVEATGLGFDTPLALARTPMGDFGVVTSSRLYLMDAEYRATLLHEWTGTTSLVDVEADTDGDLLVADALAGEVYEVDRVTGEVSVRAASTSWSSIIGIGVDDDGDVLLLGRTPSINPALWRVDGEGLVWPLYTFGAEAFGLSDVEANPVTGDALITDTLFFTGIFFSTALHQVTPSGALTTLVEGSALGSPRSLAVLP